MTRPTWMAELVPPADRREDVFGLEVGGRWYAGWTDGHRLVLGLDLAAATLPAPTYQPDTLRWLVRLPELLRRSLIEPGIWSAHLDALLRWATLSDVPRSTCKRCRGAGRHTCWKCGGKRVREHRCAEDDCTETHEGPCGCPADGKQECEQCEASGQVPPLPSHYVGTILGVPVNRLPLERVLRTLVGPRVELALHRPEDTPDGPRFAVPVIGTVERLAVVLPYQFESPGLGVFTETYPPWIAPRLPRMTPAAWAEEFWHEAGSAARTLWAALSRAELQQADVPTSTYTFGACWRLLERVPEFRGRLPEVAAVFPSWAPFVAAWPELAAMYEQDTPTGPSARLEARLRQLAKETEAA